MEFDVATIRPHKNSGGILQQTLSENPHSGTFTATGVTLKFLLYRAYDVPETQIKGGPGWLNTDLYDINAKSERIIDEQLQKMSDRDARHAKQLMLQALLAERFNLKVHIATSSGSGYALVVSKHGAKLHSSEPVEPGVDPQSLFRIYSDGGAMVFKYCPISFFVGFLSDQIQRQVVDETELSGRYDFQIRFRMQFHIPGADAILAGSDSSSPTIEDALSDQLGLKLELQSRQVETLVIDSITKPTPN